MYTPACSLLSMPPKNNPNRGSGLFRGIFRGRGRGRGELRSRGRGAGRGRGVVLVGGSDDGLGSAAAPQETNSTPDPTGVPENLLPELAEDLEFINVRRPGHGSAGTSVGLITNHFELSIRSPSIYHYDVAYPPYLDGEISRTFMDGLTRSLLKRLKEEYPDDLGEIVHDGCKNMYSLDPLPFLGQIQEYQIKLPQSTEPDKVHRVRITKTGQIISNHILNQYVKGQSSHVNEVTVAITSVNVVLAMALGDNEKYVRHKRKHFAPEACHSRQRGLELWLGYFRSARPAPGRTLLNVDMTASLVYQQGDLLTLCLSYLGKEQQGAAALEKLQDRYLRELDSLFDRCSIRTVHRNRNLMRKIKKFSRKSAQSTLTGQDEAQSVADYFAATDGRTLRFPNLPCVEVYDDSPRYIPIELCTVPYGTIIKRPSYEILSHFRRFGAGPPGDRLDWIQKAHHVLGYLSSPYHKPFGITVGNDLLRVQGRILPPPKLVYGRNEEVAPPVGIGQWRMGRQKFFRPAGITGWAVVVFETPTRFGKPKVDEIKEALSRAAETAGMTGFNTTPLVDWANPQGNLSTILYDICNRFQKAQSRLPSLIVVIMRDKGDAYNWIKHFGDTKTGVATQCMLARCCIRNSFQYFLNVILKVNVKLGGINHIISASSAPIFSDPNQPVMIMGASIYADSSEGPTYPRFISVVGSVDSYGSKYVATASPQMNTEPGQNLVEGIREMAVQVIDRFKQYRIAMEKRDPTQAAPRKVIMFRGGVPEGEFRKSIKREISELRAAFRDSDIDPELTYVVVGRRNHVRFFPENPRDLKSSDRTGNVKAGLVVDTVVGHPFEFDWYAVNHSNSSQMGTSQPVHVTVAHDESNFPPDFLQQLTYALCYTYAPSLGSVSTPAPLYYANKVCIRAAIHYDSQVQSKISEGNGAYNEDDIDQIRRECCDNFMQVHPSTFHRMYFV